MGGLGSNGSYGSRRSSHKPESTMLKAPGYPIHGRFLQKVVLVVFVIGFLTLIVTFPEYYSESGITISGESGNSSSYQLHGQSNRILKLEHNRDVVRTTSKASKTKKILAWTTIFKKDFLIYYKHRVITSQSAFSVCPVYKDCEWTIDKSEVENADAVVFHFFPGDFHLKDLPTYRRPDQKWVHMNLESPIRFKEGKMAKVDGMFNMTATYEEESDISLPYGFYYKRKNPLTNYLPPATNRTKPIVWMVSRCHTLSRREVYAADLKQYIDVDIFGACGKPAPKKGSPPINLDFREELAKEYYFYLAFENSNCVDYITEKFWSSLLAGLVPVVRGQLARYEKHAPPGSYINADAFFSYKDLAEYLNHLITHPDEYNKFFEWRKFYEVSTIATYVNLDIHCKLCSYLHTHPNHHKVYDMSERYSKTNRCFDFHHNLKQIEFEVDNAYNDEFKNFLEP